MTRIFYDVDTQNDFMNRDGALYVPGAELIKPNLRDLTKYARNPGRYDSVMDAIPIVGSVDRHFGTKSYNGREGELNRWDGPFPNHCMSGKKGQQKIDETRVIWHEFGVEPYDVAIYIPHYLDGKVRKLDLVKSIGEVVPLYELTPTKTLYFEKQNYDVFTNPAFQLFLDLAEVDEAVVYGVATDYCVRAAVEGMKKQGIQTYVVEDAIKGVAPDTTEAAIEEMKKDKEGLGAIFVTTQQVLEDRI